MHYYLNEDSWSSEMDNFIWKEIWSFLHRYSMSFGCKGIKLTFCWRTKQENCVAVVVSLLGQKMYQNFVSKGHTLYFHNYLCITSILIHELSATLFSVLDNAILRKTTAITSSMYLPLYWEILFRDW